MKRGLCLLALILHAVTVVAAPKSSTSKFSWNNLPDLPDERGVAGAFAGIHEDALIVAGGANFPRGYPWEKDENGIAPPKIYHDSVYALVKSGPEYTWEQQALKLPASVAYGVSIVTSRGVICIGGECKDEPVGGKQQMHLLTRVFRLSFDRESNTVGIDSTLPDLPFGLTSAAGALVNNVIYIAGGASDSGATNAFLSLDLGKESLVWRELPSWPGPARILPVAAGQSNGTSNDFYLFSGRLPGPENNVTYLHDAYVYRTGTKVWEKLNRIEVNGEARCIMAGVAAPIGAHSIGVFGSADGLIMEQIMEHVRAGRSDSIDEIQRLHPGFNRDVLAYNTVLDRWSTLNAFPDKPHVTSNAVKWGDAIVIPSGEISPGVRSPKIWIGTPSASRSFGALNYTALIVYLIAIILNGLWFSRRMKTTDDFFKAGNRIPWWAAGLSIFGTQLSAITFISIPATCYVSDWRRFIAQITILMAAPLVVFVFLPFYRRLNVTTAYEFLERRFNVVARTLGSLMFIVLQFGRIGIVLYIPSIALSVVTGMSIEMCILLMGSLCIVYTSLGGMEAVIWTDVVQVIVLLGGALLAICLMPGIAGTDYNSMVALADANDKFKSVDLRLDISAPTMMTFLLAGFGLNIISYGTDQAVIQRYLTTKDEKAAAKSIWTNGILALPASLIFFLIGSLLFAFYQMHPDAMDPALAKQDGVFPLFVVTQMPAGIAGLIIAAVFAASMSSLDSSMNSVSAAVTTDFYKRFGAAKEERKSLVIARVIVITVGSLGTIFALVMANLPDIKSLWDTFSSFIGLFGGGLGGLFLLAIFTRKTSGRAAVIGLLLSGIFQWWLKEISGINIYPWFYGFTGMASCFLFGILLALVMPNKKDIEGLTIYTLYK